MKTKYIIGTLIYLLLICGKLSAQDETLNVQWDVQLVPQNTDMSCWAASAAMVVGWRDDVSINPEEIADAVGYWEQYEQCMVSPYTMGLNIRDKRVTGAWGLNIKSPQSYSVTAFYDLISTYGPCMLTTFEPGIHTRVVTGMYGDGTPEGTILVIYDPWDRDMTTFSSSNEGSIYEESYSEYVRKLEVLASGLEGDISDVFFVIHP